MFAEAWFVCHPGLSDVRAHGPFFAVEEALKIVKSNSLLYKVSEELTRFEHNYLAHVVPGARRIDHTTFIPRPSPATKAARVAKLVAAAAIGPASAYQAALTVASNRPNGRLVQ